MWKDIPDPANDSFNFQAWARMAKEEPDLFEEKRRAVIETFLSSVPESRRARLRGLQWRIDVERRRAPNPLAACIKIYGMMWESFAGRKGLVQALYGLKLALARGAGKTSGNVSPPRRVRSKRP